MISESIHIQKRDELDANHIAMCRVSFASLTKWSYAIAMLHPT